MKRTKMKIVFFISIILGIQLLIFNIIPVKAEDDKNQEEIIILDNSKINVDDARHFTIGDIDGDRISEVITFKSKVKDSSTQWILNTYHKDKNIWFPVLSKIITEKISGHIHNVDVGNFDKDKAEEIIIASWEGDSSKIYLLDFNKEDKEFKIQIIYELHSLISDLEVHSTKRKFTDSIYILYSDNTDSVEDFQTNVMIINRNKKGNYKSEIIYSESKIYWNLFAIGQFIKQESDKNQILLYQFKTTASIMEEAIVRIVSSNGRVIMDDTNIGMYSEIRDIIAWDRNTAGVDELCILDIKDMGDDIGFTSKMIYCTFNYKGFLEKEERLLDSNKILNQLCIGELDDQDDSLLILDPYLGSLTYARFFDEEARAHYNFWGYFWIDPRFEVFEQWYEEDLDIYVSKSGDYDYTSSGSTSSQLLGDFYNKVDPENHGADIAIGVVKNYYSDWEVLGIAYLHGRHSIIFTDIDPDIICHEVGHNYGLYPSSSYHCPNPFCIMSSPWHPFLWDFCDSCEYYIDKDKFGPPPGSGGGGGGGGGCPFLYVFDGTEYIGEGLLDIHDVTGVDKVYIHAMQTTPSQLNNKIYLRLTEHPQTISCIDHVRLYGRLENGQWVSLHLKSAIHSTIGEVRKLLQFSDDLDVEELGADHNNGISESIDLEFVTDRETNFLELRFIIEGNNYIIK